MSLQSCKLVSLYVRCWPPTYQPIVNYFFILNWKMPITWSCEHPPNKLFWGAARTNPVQQIQESCFIVSFRNRCDLTRQLDVESGRSFSWLCPGSFRSNQVCSLWSLQLCCQHDCITSSWSQCQDRVKLLCQQIVTRIVYCWWRCI